MADGILVGSARIAILPDMRGFLAETQTKLRAEIASLNTDVPLKFTVDPGSIAKARAALGPLAAGKTVPLRFDVDAASAARAQAALGALAGKTVPIAFAVDKASLARAQAAARDAIGLMPGGTIDLNFDLSAASLAKARAQFRAATGVLPGGKLPLLVDFNYPSLQRAQAAARAAIGLMPGGTIPLNVDLNQTSLARAQAQFRTMTGAFPGATLPLHSVLNKPSLLSALAAAQAAASAKQAKLPLTVTFNSASMMRAQAAYLTASKLMQLKALAQMRATSAGMAALAAGAGAGATKGGGGGSGGGLAAFLGGLSGRGGAGTRTGGGGGGGGGGRGIFGWGTIGAVSAWHVALDGVAEATISVGLAMAAAATGIATMAPAVSRLSDDLHSVWAVSSALHQNIPPLTGDFSKFIKQMAPQTVEAYGGALDIINQNSGALKSTGSQVVTMFDDWIIKIDEWSRSQHGMGGLLQSGVGYLSQFGKIIGTVGEDIAGLLKQDPGIARYLLDIVQGIADVVGVLLKLPGPLRVLPELALALHGVYLWGNVLAAPLTRAAGALGILSGAQVKATRSALSFRNVLKFLTTNPYAWAAEAAAGLAYLTYRGTQADSATQKLITKLNTGLASENASQAILQITTDIGRLNTAIVNTKPENFAKGWDSVGNTLTRVEYTAGSAWSEFTKTFTAPSIGSFFVDLGRSINDFVTGTGAMKQRATVDIAALNHELDSLVGKQKNLFAETGNLMHQGNSYAQSLALMDMAGVKAGDSLDTMRMKVALMIKGYENMGQTGGMLTNSVNAVTFALWQQDSDVAKVNQGWDTFFSTVTGGSSGFVSFAQGLDTLDASLKKAHTSMTGLNASSLTARQNFLSAAGGASTEMDNLTTLVSAAGLGAKGTRLLAQATKDMLARMLPAAKGSEQMTTALYALAQRGGYQGADSFKALSTWAGNVQHPMSSLDGIVTRLTKDAGNLTTDVKNLANALSINLSSAEATAIVAAHGGTQVFDKFAEAVVHTGVDSGTTQKAADKLGTELTGVIHNASDAKSEFISFAVTGLDVTKTKAEQLWNTFRQQQLDSTAAKAAETKTQFDKLATSLGVTRTAADKVWASLHKVAAGSPYNARESITGSGSWKLAGGLAGQFAGGGYQAMQNPAKHATGGRIPGYGGGDVVPALLEPGETVVPKHLTPKFARAFKIAGIPGFAAGGIVPSYAGNLGGLGQWATNNAQATTAAFANALAQSFSSASSGFGIPGAAAAGTGTAQAIAKRLLAAMGWASQWPALDYLWTRESGWNYRATNPTSGAYGIPQALPAGKMAAAGADWRTDPATQIRWGLGYIKSVYGSPDAAWAHEISHGWYDNGGILPPGLTLAANTTGQNEVVLRADQLANLAHSGANVTNYTANITRANPSDIQAAFQAMEMRQATQQRIGRAQ